MKGDPGRPYVDKVRYRAGPGGAIVAMALILLEDGGPISLDTELVSVLSGIGATGVVILRDEMTVALVVEGWALEMSRLEEAVNRLAAGRRTRTLHTVTRMTVVPSERGYI